jgi:hypothetical protein
LFPGFDSQLKLLRENTYQKIEEKIRQLESQQDLSSIVDTLADSLKAMLAESVSFFGK